MAGIQDGRYIEERSTPLNRLEVDVVTSVDFGDVITRVDGDINNLDIRVTALEVFDLVGLEAHLLEEISVAHGGVLNIEAQVPNGSIGTHKVSFTVLTLGETSLHAAAGNHTHDSGDITDYDPADYVRKTGSIAESITGIKTFEDDVVIQSNLTVNGTVTTVNSETLVVTDNELTLNNGETGAGVSLGVAGIRIDRGTAPDYLINFVESDDTLKAGMAGSTLGQVAFISDIENQVVVIESATAGGADIFAGNTLSRAVDMGKDMGASYEVTITPKMTAPGDVSSVGTWYWVRTSNTHFAVYNTGSNTTVAFSWIARKN